MLAAREHVRRNELFTLPRLLIAPLFLNLRIPVFLSDYNHMHRHLVFALILGSNPLPSVLFLDAYDRTIRRCDAFIFLVTPVFECLLVELGHVWLVRGRLGFDPVGPPLLGVLLVYHKPGLIIFFSFNGFRIHFTFLNNVDALNDRG